MQLPRIIFGMNASDTSLSGESLATQVSRHIYYLQMPKHLFEEIVRAPDADINFSAAGVFSRETLIASLDDTLDKYVSTCVREKKKPRRALLEQALSVCPEIFTRRAHSAAFALAFEQK